MIQYLLKLSIDNETIDCLPLDAGEKGLGLDESGVTWLCENTPVRIEVVHHELHIVQNSTKTVSVLRNGRERKLKKGQSIRLCAQDEIHIGEQIIVVTSILKSTSNGIESIIQNVHKAGRIAMMTTATALALCACNPNKAPIIDEQLTGDVAVNSPIMDCQTLHNNDVAQIKACCENQTNEDDRKNCCDEFELIYKDQCKPLVIAEEKVHEIPEQPAHGAFRRSPCANLTNPEEIKACCMGIEDKDLRAGCCMHLDHHFEGIRCEEPPTIEEHPMGEPPMPEPVNDTQNSNDESTH